MRARVHLAYLSMENLRLHSGFTAQGLGRHGNFDEWKAEVEVGEGNFRGVSRQRTTMLRAFSTALLRIGQRDGRTRR